MTEPTHESDRVPGLPAHVPEVVPLFPLPDHVLLPDLPVPYRVFEPRYRQLVEDLLLAPDAGRWLGIPRLQRGAASAEEAPAFHAVATLGTMVHVSQLPEEHYFIVVRGFHRVRLEEVDSDRLYRRARVTALADLDGDVDAAELARRQGTVRQLVASLSPHLGEAAGEVHKALRNAPDLTTEVYRLGAICLPDPDRRQRLLEARHLGRRLELLEDALAAALAFASQQGEGPEAAS